MVFRGGGGGPPRRQIAQKTKTASLPPSPPPLFLLPLPNSSSRSKNGEAARRALAAVPSTDSSAFSRLTPSSSLTTVPPVRMAMSSRYDVLRSPKPGALTATTLSVPRSLLTTSVASASCSTSSAMMSSG